MTVARLRALLVAVAAVWLLDCGTAHATAIAFSNLTAQNLIVQSSAGSVIFDPNFETQAFAQAQNSLGGADFGFDDNIAASSAASATTVWANAQATSSSTQWTAASNVTIPGEQDGNANSKGDGTWLTTFTIVGATNPVQVSFSIDLTGLLHLQSGVQAQTETIFNLNVDGDPVLFLDDLQAIGRNSFLVDPISKTLSGSVTLDPTRADPYSLVLRVDSESFAINEAPEPATLVLLGIGLFGAHRYSRSRKASPRG